MSKTGHLEALGTAHKIWWENNKQTAKSMDPDLKQ